MDEQLLKLVQDDKPHDLRQSNFHFIDETGLIEANIAGQLHLHTLKPLAELYGPGVLPQGTVDPLNQDYMPLFLSIEESILRHNKVDPSLTDAGVELSLERLALSPESDTPPGSLERHLQLDLRLLLSINNYSRHDVRGALRKVAKSVSRHSRQAGPRGYLTFIREQFRQ